MTDPNPKEQPVYDQLVSMFGKKDVDYAIAEAKDKEQPVSDGKDTQYDTNGCFYCCAGYKRFVEDGKMSHYDNGSFPPCQEKDPPSNKRTSRVSQ